MKTNFLIVMNKNFLENMEGKTPTFLNGNGGKKLGRGMFGLLLVAFFAFFLNEKAVAQTDYSGVYYIGSVGYNPSTPTSNYYLCPAEGWCFYKPVNDFAPHTSTDYPNPFLTTYKCKGTSGYDATKALWTIEKVLNSDYYHIMHTKTGKYVLSNGQIRTTTNADRMRVHLEAVTGELDDKALFAIEPYSTYLVIRIVSPDGINGETHKWLVVNGGNKQSLKGESGKTGGPTGYENTCGIIGIYTQDDINAPFYLEPATIAPPTIINNFDGTITITAATGATIYYTTDGTTPTTSSLNTGITSVTFTITDEMDVIKAIAKAADFDYPTPVTTYYLPVCSRPVITVNEGIVTISCSTSGASIYYTLDDTPATPTSTLYSGPFDLQGATVVRAIATKLGYKKSVEAFYYPAELVHSSSEITNMNGRYVLASDFVSTASIGTQADPFQGSIDGNMITLSGLDHSFVAYANNAIIKSIILQDVTISGSGNVGAICNEAKGYTCIYNCGILPTTADFPDGSHSTVTATGTNGCAGGIVGLLDDDSRVVNCFSYADIYSSGYAAGIVGNNTFASNASVTTVDGQDKYANLRTMVVNCIYYGDIKSGNSIWPVYGGEKISNSGDYAINNYNFYSDSCHFVRSFHDYNCSWPARYDYLTRYEFHRYLLNSNRELCGWWVGAPSAPSTMTTTDVQAVPKDASLMAKWVLDPSIAPYPILKSPGFYHSPINIDADADWRSSANEWEGKNLGTLSVTIKSGAQYTATDVVKTITITDMDTLHSDYCYRKIQLPYYNSVFGDSDGDTWEEKYAGNYTNYVVTGWEITDVTGGTPGQLVQDWQDGYNFADRNCTVKDQYPNRIFAQGGFYYVPNDVTAIEITAHWGKAFYLGNGDNSYDRVDFDHLVRKGNPDVVLMKNHRGTAFEPAGFRPSTLPNGQIIRTDSITAVAAACIQAQESVFDNALVLVNNHQFCQGPSHIAVPNHTNYGFTIMSADFDLDDEPDYCLEWQLGQGTTRQSFCPIRFDFLPVEEIGLCLKKEGSTQYYSLGCYRPLGHFEVTETALIRFGQFEFSNINRTLYAPLILNGGIYEQYVKSTRGNAFSVANDRIDYIILGGNVYLPSFTPGAHVNTNANFPTRHCAVNVIGGKIDYLYLSGNYNNAVTPNQDNPHCYIDGGWFQHMAAAGKEGIDGNVTFKINHARIREFYGGSTMSKDDETGFMVVTGNIDVTIDNSIVDKYCGGPKFGDMRPNKTVTTSATGTTFGVYYGAGNGGTNYVQYHRTDIVADNSNGYNWNGSNNGQVSNYIPRKYRDITTGYQADYDMELINVSTGTYIDCAVNRTYFYAAQYAATNTGPVSNTLTNCIVKTNFYGAGNLGGVLGVANDQGVVVGVNSTLIDTQVYDSVFGAGYSASIPNVDISERNKGVPTIDLYTGYVTPQTEGSKTRYTWSYKNPTTGEVVPQGVVMPNTVDHDHPDFVYDGKNYFYTEVSLDSLGTVRGNVTLTIKGNSVIGTDDDPDSGFVYGGGDESAVKGNITVSIQGKSYIYGDVFGGGNKGGVKGNTSVTIKAEPPASGNSGQQPDPGD